MPVRASFAVLICGTLLAACTRNPVDTVPEKGPRIHFEVINNVSQTAALPTANRTENSPGITACTRAAVLSLLGGDSADSLFLHVTLSDSIPSAGTVVSDSDTRAAPVTGDTFYNAFAISGYAFDGVWNESLTPDFIYDTEVRKQGGDWTLTPDIFWPAGEKSVRFFAYAPYNGSGLILSAANQTGTPVLTYTVPDAVADQSDLMTAAPSVNGPGDHEAVALNFKHVLTAVKFVVGDDMTPGRVTKITLKGIYANAEQAIGGTVWTGYGSTADFSQELDFTSEGTPGEQINTPEATFMMLPQTLPPTAAIEVEFTDNYTGAEHTLSAAIAGGVWPMGYTVTYRISTSSILIDPVFEIVNPADFGYEGGDNVFSVTSYVIVTDASGVTQQAPEAWTPEFSTDNGATWGTTAPDWLTGFPASGAGSTTAASYTASVAPQTPETVNPHNDALRAAGPVNDYDLSTNGGTTVINTANCYLVNAPGTYRFPLAYGNAVKNGETNTKSYVSNLVSPALPRMVNHLGAAISDPYIYNNANCVPNNACLVWQDEPDLITNIALSADGKFITFEVPHASIRQGNAIVALRDVDNKIMWSWHIWVTDYKLGDDLKTVTNYRGRQYVFMPVNVGWCDPDTTRYAARSAVMRITQKKTRKTQQIVINQPEKLFIVSGNNTYYQFGRKDPMLPIIIDAGGTAVDKACYATEYPFSKSGKGKIRISTSIGVPHIFYNYGSLPITDWANGEWNNRWNNNRAAYGTTSDLIQKTVYDPSPAGYSLPPAAAWTGFTYNGASQSGNYFLTRYNSPYASSKEVDDNFGWILYCNKMLGLSKPDPSGGTIYFPITGGRLDSDGSITRVGIVGFYWSSDTQNRSDAYNFQFTNSSLDVPTYRRRAPAFPVRSVAENP